MKVNFNNIRKQALHRHDDLVVRLNEAIIHNDDNYAHPNDLEYEVNLRGYVVIDADDLKDVLNDLRMLIGTIASCHEEGNPDAIDVYSEVYPEDTDKRMAIFNNNEV